MKRNILSKLFEWKDSVDRKPLILMGARQVGKTWIMKHFGEVAFENVAYVNCDTEKLVKRLFEKDYDIDRILLTLQAITGTKIEAGKTLIILDELQEVPRGLHCLKYFCENAPEYHIVVAGSLLGITIGKGESFPVGKVNIMRVHPMNFEEFLMACGEDALCEALRINDIEMIEILRSKYINLLRQYYFVGGMPEVVSKFVKSHDLKAVRQIQNEILSAYRRDISKHTTSAESILIGQILNSIPSQLTKENKKFIYSAVKKGARASTYELAIQWLIDAGIVYKVNRVNAIKMPLKFYEDINAFKLFLLDCGLFACMADAPAAQILADDNIFIEFRGAFTEQFVHQQFLSFDQTLYYWSNPNSQAEIDFVIQTESRVVPIEVKASENVRAKSMHEYIKSHSNDNLKGLRISMLPHIDQGWMENFPLYSINSILQTPLPKENECFQK